MTHADLPAGNRDALTMFVGGAMETMGVALLSTHRLLALVSDTVLEMTVYPFSAIRQGGWSPQFAAKRAQGWAQKLVGDLGIDVRYFGTPPEQPVLFVANHRSYIDIVAILKRVPVAFLAKAELARWPLFGAAARYGNAVFVQRDNRASRRESREALKKILDAGVSVVVFAEGTTFEGPGILEFRRGMFHLAAEAGIPVVPVAVDYADSRDAWVGDDTFLGHFVRVFSKPTIQMTVAFGPTLCGADAEGMRSAAQDWVKTHAVQDPPSDPIPRRNG